MSESTSQASFSLAGFQVTIIGRFWVTAEVIPDSTIYSFLRVGVTCSPVSAQS